MAATVPMGARRVRAAAAGAGRRPIQRNHLARQAARFLGRYLERLQGARRFAGGRLLVLAALQNHEFHEIVVTFGDQIAQALEDFAAEVGGQAARLDEAALSRGDGVLDILWPGEANTPGQATVIREMDVDSAVAPAPFSADEEGLRHRFASHLSIFADIPRFLYDSVIGVYLG